MNIGGVSFTLGDDGDIVVGPSTKLSDMRDRLEALGYGLSTKDTVDNLGRKWKYRICPCDGGGAITYYNFKGDVLAAIASIERIRRNDAEYEASKSTVESGEPISGETKRSYQDEESAHGFIDAPGWEGGE